MYCQSLQEKLFDAEMFKNVNIQHPDYDREMTLVANIVREHACELIIKQYSYVIGPASYTFYEGCHDVYFIKSTSTDDAALGELNAEYSVTKRDWKCSCLFMCTRFLPCRHVFFLRKALGLETVIPTHLLNKRWLISTVRAAIANESTNVDEPAPKPFEVKSQALGLQPQVSEALPIASEICDTMTEFGMTQYQEAMQYLQTVAGRFKRGEFEDPAQHLPTQRDTGSIEITQVESPSDRASQPDNNTRDSSDQSTRVVTLSNQSGSVEDQSGSVGDKSGQVGIQIESTTLSSATKTPHFPPRSRGRQKKTATAKKSLRKKAVSVAREDSEVYASNLNVASLEASLTTKSTYLSAAEVIEKFQMVEYGFKFKSPTARMISSLPPTKLTMPPEAITHIL
ncbi:hypothetical protein PHPALM_5376 [Phytophthora palmivora]|uniref:SWIM-type domain-containing protein n=1 Tax=Phytophthora palmivora TaxID=4796 RepID=A0A2P4YHI7_9STRA|nr:hypothetical protein PHPALM_5376 [Phytophthora palmivora]